MTMHLHIHSFFHNLVSYQVRNFHHQLQSVDRNAQPIETCSREVKMRPISTVCTVTANSYKHSASLSE